MLFNLGYRLEAINLPMVDTLSRRYDLDILATRTNPGVGLMIDCKTYAP